MRIGVSRVTLRDFRNIEEETLFLAPGLNLLTGQNAQGKTSVLESLTLLSTGRILRSSRDAEAVRHGRPNAQVGTTLIDANTTLAIELTPGRRKKATLNGLNLPRPSDLIGRLPSVCFWSGDLAIVAGEPSDRRSFMDMELSQLYPAYLKSLTIYKRALEQRNALLKRAQEEFVSEEEFEVWETPMAESGEELRRYRREWVTTLSEKAQEAHQRLSGGEQVSLTMIEKDQRGMTLSEALKDRRVDIARGVSNVGPQRDDMLIEINGTSAKVYGSQGQQRTAVISIKLAVFEVARENFGAPPLLLLDDIFSDLDASRRQNLVGRAVELGGQVLITCTEPGQAGEELVKASRVFRVDSGRVTVQE